MGSVGGPRHYAGQGLGPIGKWTCPGCDTDHVTPLELGCPVCLAADAKRSKAIAGAVTQIEELAPYLLVKADSPAATVMIQGLGLTEAARQTVAAALGHFVEHGAPDESLLPKPVMIGWARQLAGLEEER